MLVVYAYIRRKSAESAGFEVVFFRKFFNRIRFGKVFIRPVKDFE